MSQTQPASPVSALRRARTADLDALQALVGRLSLSTSARRFFSPATRIPTWQARLLLQSTDTRGAWVAVRGGRLVGHACWVRTAATSAELAVVVEDGWQGSGLGRSLVRAAVADAGAAGVSELELVVQPDNRRMIGTIRRSWPTAVVEHQPGTLTFRARIAAREVEARVETAV